MFKKLLHTSELRAFSVRLAQVLRSILPPEACQQETDQAVRARGQATRKLAREVDLFLSKNTLGFFAKAKLGVVLQEALESEGYPSDFAKALAYDVVADVAQRSAP